MTKPRGPVLALDCSTSTATVGLGGVDRAVVEVSSAAGAAHSSTLLPSIDMMMSAAGLTPADLAAVVVGEGPGSFTGLRIAAATAKGIVHALGIPLLAYSSLLATAVPFLEAAGQPVAVLFDARGRDLYAACYRLAGEIEVIVPPRAFSLDEVILALGGIPGLRLVGDGAERHREELLGRLPDAATPVDGVHGPRASSLLWLADRYPEVGLVQDAAAWEPEYLRPSGAERIAAARSASAAAAS